MLFFELLFTAIFLFTGILIPILTEEISIPICKFGKKKFKIIIRDGVAIVFNTLDRRKCSLDMPISRKQSSIAVD